jgi:DNA-binding response OmpR family regulator
MNTLDSTTKRILIVEDEPSIANLCQRVLAREGFEVEIAVNGTLAQEMIEKKQYHICIIDIRTPQLSGADLYQWLQKNYLQVANHVIFTTGSVIEEKTMAFIEQSGRPFLSKPFTPNELTAIVKEALK